MKQVLVNFALPPDICLQVSDMVREAVDTAITQLTANGGGQPPRPEGYTHAARTAAELRESVGSETQVPAGQKANTDGMAADLAALVNQVSPDAPGEIIIPKKVNDGWVF